MWHGPRNSVSKHAGGTTKPMTPKQKRRAAKRRRGLPDRFAGIHGPPADPFEWRPMTAEEVREAIVRGLAVAREEPVVPVDRPDGSS